MDDFRGGGGGPPPEQLPPSLLQMAQGNAPDGGGLLPGWQSDPGLNNGTPFRQITSPEDQNWSDLQGNPIHMGGPPPAFNPGTTAGGYNAVFDPRNPSSQGGWFTMADYNKGNTQGIGQTNQSRPGSATQLSTNNWRLLPPGFQDPDYFMADGSIVSRRAAQSALAPRSVLGVEGAEPPGYYFKGGGQWTRPFGSGGAMTGNIGSGDPWSIFSTPTY